MREPTHRSVALLAAVLVLAACSDHAVERIDGTVAATPRRTVVWLGEDGIDAETATRLALAGVDEIVVRRGAILLSSGAPVVQLLPSPVVEGSIPTAVALEVPRLRLEDPESAADAVWAALEADFGGLLPSEIILDIAVLGDGAGAFISRLALQSGLAVVPVLSVAQIGSEAGQAAAVAAHRCIVPIFGAQEADLRGLDPKPTRPLEAKLAAISDLGVRVRLAISLRPKTDPDVPGWAEDINPLTDGESAQIKRTSTLDRSFAIQRPVTWAGRSFGVGEVISIAWVDTARLGAFFVEAHRTILPEIAGWDLVSLPPVGQNLGLDRDELIGYLGGEGPAPTIDVKIQRNGRTLVVELTNTSVFRSAITSVSNWVQVELAAGALVASSRGSFDRVVLGSIKDGDWRPNPPGGPDAVRFVETYLAPGEEKRTGSIRLPSSRSRVTVRWQVRMSDGTAISGVAD